MLFVCTGNTCRSPLAQVQAVALLKEAGLTGWQIASAGLAALPGQSASRHALTAAGALQLDLSAHQSRPLLRSLAEQADLILAMTVAHKEEILGRWPEQQGKVYTLHEFSGVAGEVTDPFGGTAADYLETAQELDLLLRRVVARLAAPEQEEPME